MEQSADFQIDLDGIEIIDPATYPMVDTFAQSYVDMGKEKGTEISLEEARKLISTNPLYFGSFLVKFDIADGMVAGSTYTAHDVIQAALRVIGTQPGVSTVSSSVIMITDSPQFGDDGVFILGDCSVVIDPNPTQLADIAVNCVERARRTAKILDPKVALLSYSTKGSGQGEPVANIQEALALLRDRNVDFDYDGELQADAAMIPRVARLKAEKSPVAGQANVLISQI